MREKLREERNRRVMRALKITAAAAAVALVLAVRFYVPRLVGGLSVFEIRKIAVEPAGYETFVRQLLAVAPGESLLSFDMAKACASVREVYFIEDCRIRKDFPSTLRVLLTIRKPWVTVRNGDRVMLMDRKGSFLPFEGVSTAWTIEGIPVGDVGGSTADSDVVEILAGIERWYNYYRVANLFPVRTLSFADLERIELRGDEGVVYLYPEELERKFARLRAVLETCREEAIAWEYIDMRFTQPYVKKKGSDEGSTVGGH
jgi:cell division septal protein FtsQ